MVAALIALPVFSLHPAPIEGPGSIGRYAALAGGAAGALAFVVGRLVLIRRGSARPIRTWLDGVDVAAIAVAHGVVAALAITLLAELFALGFIGATVYPIAGILLAGAVPAVAAYLSFASATQLTLQNLAVLLAAFLAMGVLTSTITATDPQWWREHLSSLGTTADLSSLAFNGTLIVAGILVTVLARRSAEILPTSVPGGAERVRLCLVLVGVFLALVGVFPVDAMFWVHTGAASGMAIIFGLLAFRIRAWVPDFAQSLALLGRGYFVLVVVLGAAFAFGDYTLTAVELVAGVLIFSWIVLYLQAVSALARDAQEPTSSGHDGEPSS